MPRAVLPSAGVAGFAPASLGRPTCPMPWPLLKAAWALLKSKFPAASTSLAVFSCHTHIICAAFSSSVIRASKSLARALAERRAFLYGGTASFLVAMRQCPVNRDRSGSRGDFDRVDLRVLDVGGEIDFENTVGH